MLIPLLLLISNIYAAPILEVNETSIEPAVSSASISPSETTDPVPSVTPENGQSVLSDLLRDISLTNANDEVHVNAPTPLPQFHDLYDMLFSSEFKDLVDTSGSDIGSRKLRFYAGPKDLQTKDKCFIVSLHEDTPQHVVEKIRILLQSPFLQGNLTGIFEKVFKGVTVCFDSSGDEDTKFPSLHILEKIPWIDIIERDTRISASQLQKEAPWYLDRISHPDLPITWRYPFDQIASGVCAYVIDSGVQANHSEFNGRVDPVYSSFGDPVQSGTDIAGHGTEVASVLAGTNLGVAKGALIKSVQVLGPDGGGKNTDLIRGLEWIATHLQLPAVINLSLCGPKSAALDIAVNKILKMKVPVVVAAGNYKKDACVMSPCNLPGCITVAATTNQDVRAPFSNFGTCVDIFAPGSNIMVATPNSQSTSKRPSIRGYSIASGTSLAAPLVSGTIALLLFKNASLDRDAIWSEIESLAVRGKISEEGLNRSPNLLLQIPHVKDAESGPRLVNFSAIIPNPRIFDPDKNDTWGPLSGDPTLTSTSSLETQEWNPSTSTWIILGASLGGALLIGIGIFFWIRSKLKKRDTKPPASQSAYRRPEV